MSWSRRAVLSTTPIAALACVRLPRVPPPAAWVDVCFGRHVLSVPKPLITSVQASFQLGSLLGAENSDPDEFAVAVARSEETARGLMDANTRLYSPRIEEFDHGQAKVRLVVVDRGSSTPDYMSMSMLISGGNRPLLLEDSLKASSADEAARDLRAFADTIEPLPAVEHQTPFCTPSYSVEIEPKLSQKIAVSMGAVDGRALMLESAFVRGREHSDLGAPPLARNSLAYARMEHTGTGVPNLHVRRRTVKVAGIRAPEVVWTTDEGRGGLLHFAWIHLGVANDAWRPFISAYFSGDLALQSRRELGEQWEAILGSLRPIPPTPRCGQEACS